MGTFIPIQIPDEPQATSDYSLAFSQFKHELSVNNGLSLSRFCASQHISYQGMLSYLEQNDINLKSIRMTVSKKMNIDSSNNSLNISDDLRLSNVSINAAGVKVTIPKVSIDQLADLLNSIRIGNDV